MFVPVLLPLLFFLYVGMRGADFGSHWDEWEAVGNAAKSFRTGTLLPLGPREYQPELNNGYYSYPSVIYWVTLGTAATELGHADGPVPGNGMDHVIQSKEFLLKVRKVCVFISSLAVVWIYLAVLVMRGGRRWPEALLAAAVAATSWELEYHSRWLATDAMATQFVALAVLCSLVAYRSSRPRLWLVLAAIATGLSAGTKYPAGAVFVVVIVTAALVGAAGWSWRNMGRIVADVAICTGAMGVAYLLTTPGTLLQPWNFVAWIQFDRVHYATGHVGQTVLTRWTYLKLMGEYLSMVLLSPYAWAAASLAGSAVAGAAAMLLGARRRVIPMLVYVLFYVVYFSGQHAMVVRNLLMLSPPIMILSGIGAGWLAGQAWALAGRAGKGAAWAASGAVWAAAVVVVGYSATADVSYARAAAPAMDAGRSLEAARAWMKAHPKEQVYLSGKVAKELGRVDEVSNPTLHARPGHEFVMTYPSEDSVPWRSLRWPANVRGLAVRDLGPFAVNFDYYPTWQNPQIVLLPLEKARCVPVAQVERAVDLRDAMHDTPEGFKLVSFLSCGMDPVDARSHVTLRMTRGTAYEAPIEFGKFASAVTTMAYDPQAIEVKVSGLNPSSRYMMKIVWANLGSDMRIERVECAMPDGPPKVLVPNTAVPQLTWSDQVRDEGGAYRRKFRLPAETYRSGEFTMRAVLVAGPNAVLSEVWLYERNVKHPVK